MVKESMTPGSVLYELFTKDIDRDPGEALATSEAINEIYQQTADQGESKSGSAHFIAYLYNDYG